MTEAITQRFLVDPCPSQEEERAVVEEELERFGLDDWQVVVTIPFDESRPCASIVVDADQHVVELVPIPRP
jgi:hypothetical protein